MELVSFDGYVFNDHDFWCGFDQSAVRGQWSLDPTTLGRSGSTSILAGTSISTRPIPVEIGYDGLETYETAFFRLQGVLDPVNPEPRLLVAKLNDNTLVQCRALVLLPGGQTDDPAVNVVKYTFLSMSPRWEKVTPAAPVTAAISSSGTEFTAMNNGPARAYPIYKVGWTVQRATQTSAVGWKYRMTQTLTNNETRAETRNTRFIELGDTAALVTGGKALSSGNDLRVRVNGRELPRTLMNWNTKYTILAVVVTIPALSSITLELVYGNPAAGTPQTLNTLGGARTRPDLFTAVDCYSTNGTATAGGASTLTDSGKAWPVNRLKGGMVRIVSGTGTGRWRRIASNTANQITTTRPWGATPDTSSVYVIWMGGIFADGGVVSSATSNTLTDSSQSFGPNSLKGATVITATGGTRTITGNTDDTITVTPNWTSTPSTSAVFTIIRPGFHRYALNRLVKRAIDDVWMGLWYQDARFSRPSVVQTGADGIANAWQPFLMLRNNDRFAQKSVTPQDMGGSDTDYFNGVDANRGVGGGKTYKEQGAADGAMISNAHGYDAVYYDFEIKNPNGVANGTFRSRGDGGLEWRSIRDYTTTQASITQISPAWADLTGDEETNLDLYMGLLPAPDADNETVEIPSTASKTATATIRTYQYMELYLNLDNWSNGTLSAEEEIYDLNATIKIGALSANPPYDQIVIGGSGHYLHLTSTQELWITTDPDSLTDVLALYDDGVYVKPVAWAANIYRVIQAVNGSAVSTISQEFAPLTSGTNTITVTEAAIGTLSVELAFVESYLA